MRWMVLSLLLLCPAVRAGEDPARQGLELLRRGKAKEALPLLRQAVKEAGQGEEEPAPALLFNLGLAALRTGKLEEAESAFRRARAAAGEEQGIAAPAGLGLGASFWERGLAAEQGGPQGLDRAIELTRQAREAWIRTLVEGDGYDPARRNVERANRRLEELEKKKKEREKKEQERKRQEKEEQKDKEKKEKQKEKQQEKEKQKQQKPEEKKDREKEKEKKEERQQEQKRRPQPGEKEKSGEKKEKQPWSKEQMQKLVNRLKKLEKERRALMRKLRPRRPPGGRDW